MTEKNWKQYAACRLDPGIMSHLKAISKREYRTVSSTIRLAVDRFVTDYLKNNPDYAKETMNEREGSS